MYISEPLREAIYANADTGTAFLHTPKAAGSTVAVALRRRRAVLSLGDVAGSHRPGCACGSAECRARARHERRFLSRLRPGEPWVLNLGHLRLTREEAADIPPGMPLVVPLRDSAERLVSYFRYYWTVAEAAPHSRVLVTRRHALTWNPSVGVPLASVPRLSRDPRKVAAVRANQHLPAQYVEEDGYRIRWQAWLTDALAAGSSPFLYRDLLPDLQSTHDPRWARLVPMTVPDVVRWAETVSGGPAPRRNVSRTTSSRYDLERAAAAVSELAAERVHADAEMWELLSTQALSASAGARA